MKKIILVNLITIIIGLSSPLNQGLISFAQGQTVKTFDLTWSRQDQVSEADDFPGKALIIPGASIIFVAQPDQKLTLNDYNFSWYLNKQEQKAANGLGKNYLQISPSPGIIYEVVLQIKKGDQIIQTENLSFLPQEPAVFVYQKPDRAETSFYFKKAIQEDFPLKLDTAFSFKALVHYLASNNNPSFFWQVGAVNTLTTQDDSFTLTIPKSLPKKEPKGMEADVILKTGETLKQKINLVWL